MKLGRDLLRPRPIELMESRLRLSRRACRAGNAAALGVEVADRVRRHLGVLEILSVVLCPFLVERGGLGRRPSVGEKHSRSVSPLLHAIRTRGCLQQAAHTLARHADPSRSAVAGSATCAGCAPIGPASYLDGPDPRASYDLTKGALVLRLVRLLPVLIPLVTSASRNPKVRELLHLKPQPGQGRAGKRR